MDNLGLARLDTLYYVGHDRLKRHPVERGLPIRKESGTSYSVQEYTTAVESFTTALF